MTDYVCPGCQSNGVAEECWHDEQTWALAEALRDAVQDLHQIAPTLTPIDMAWGFIDAADALNGMVGEPPYAVEVFHPANIDAYTTVGLVNGRYLFAVPNAEGGAPAQFIGDCGGRLSIVPQSNNIGSLDPRTPHQYNGNRSGDTCWVGQYHEAGMCRQPEEAPVHQPNNSVGGIRA